VGYSRWTLLAPPGPSDDRFAVSSARGCPLGAAHTGNQVGASSGGREHAGATRATVRGAISETGDGAGDGCSVGDGRLIGAHRRDRLALVHHGERLRLPVRHDSRQLGRPGAISARDRHRQAGPPDLSSRDSLLARRDSAAHLRSVAEWKALDLPTASDERLLEGVRELARSEAVYWGSTTLALAVAKNSEVAPTHGAESRRGRCPR